MSEVYSTFVAFKRYVENSIGNKIKSLHSDSGVSLLAIYFNHFLKLMVFSISLVVHTPLNNKYVWKESIAT